MGIDLQAFNFLMDSRLRMGPFDKTLQIGRQQYYFLDEDKPIAETVIRKSGMGLSFESFLGSGESGTFADKMFASFGSAELHTMDFSDYEGATIVHDLNDPVPSRLHGQYDTIFDGGSIEHIFNTPTVVKNYISMLRDGGRLLIVTTANNFLGHGFYQFSPEWAYRTFGEGSGCVVEAVYLVDSDEKGAFMAAADPLRERRRFAWNMTRCPTYIMIAARRVGSGPFHVVPQQSDYAAAWKAKQQADSAPAAESTLEHERSSGDVEEHRTSDGVEEHRSSGDTETHRASGDAEAHRSSGDVEEHRTSSDAEEHRTPGDAEAHRSSGDAEEHRASGDAEGLRPSDDAGGHRQSDEGTHG